MAKINFEINAAQFVSYLQQKPNNHTLVIFNPYSEFNFPDGFAPSSIHHSGSTGLIIIKPNLNIYHVFTVVKKALHHKVKLNPSVVVLLKAFNYKSACYRYDT